MQTIGYSYKMCSPAGIPRDSSVEAFASLLALFLPLLCVVNKGNSQKRWFTGRYISGINWYLASVFTTLTVSSNN